MEGRQDEGMARAMAEANEVFGQLGEAVERAAQSGEPIDVLKVGREVGLEIDDAILERLELPRLIYPIRFCPWWCWYPWRPFWCWWWGRYYPWYRCCPYWWHRCHPWIAA